MSPKLQELAALVAEKAFPSRDDDYSLDIISIIEMVMLIVEGCDLNSAHIAERASSIGLFDRLLVRWTARKAGYRPREIGTVTDAFVECCETSSRDDLLEAIIEAKALVS